MITVGKPLREDYVFQKTRDFRLLGVKIFKIFPNIFVYKYLKGLQIKILPKKILLDVCQFNKNEVNQSDYGNKRYFI